METTSNSKDGYSKPFYTSRANKDESIYASVSWTIESGYKMTLSAVALTVYSYATSYFKYLAEISDGTTTILSDELSPSKETDGTFTFSDGELSKALTGTVTLKIYVYGYDNISSGKRTYLKSPVTITGNIVQQSPSQDPPEFTVNPSTGEITITNQVDGASYYYSTNGNIPEAGVNGAFYTTPVPSGTYYAGDIVVLVHKDGYEDAISTNANPIVVGTLGTLSATTPDKTWSPADIPGITGSNQDFTDILLFDNTLLIHGTLPIANYGFKVKSGSYSDGTIDKGIEFKTSAAGKLNIDVSHASSDASAEAYTMTVRSESEVLGTKTLTGAQSDIFVVDVPANTNIFIYTSNQMNIRSMKYYAPIAVTGVTVSPTTESIEKGGTAQLTATVAPADATNQNVTWSSSNESVATVDANGLVTAVATGRATITVTTEDGGFTATREVTVVESSEVPTGITPKLVTNKDGEVYAITAAKMYDYYDGGNGWVTDGNGDAITEGYFSEKSATKNADYINPETEETETPSSSPSGILIKAKGTANRSARFYFTGAVKAAAFMCITKSSGATVKMEIHKTSDDSQVGDIVEATGNKDEYKMLEATGLDAATEYYALVYSTDDASLYAIKLWASSAPIYATSVSLDKTTLDIDGDGSSATLTATVDPVTYNEGLTWTSSDPSKAIVDENGVVTTIPGASGTVTITVKAKSSESGEINATCTVNITEKTQATEFVTLPSDKETVWGAGNGTNTTFGGFVAANGTTVSGNANTSGGKLLNYAGNLRAWANGKDINLYTESLYFVGGGATNDGESHICALEFRVPTKGKIHVEMQNNSEDARSYVVKARYTKGGVTTTKTLRTMTLYKGDGSNVSYGYSTLDAYFEEEGIEGGYATIFIHTTASGLYLKALSYTPNVAPEITNTYDTYSRFSSTATQDLYGVGSVVHVGTRLSNSEVTTPITIKPKDGYMIEKVDVTWAETTFDHDVNLALTNCNTSRINDATTTFIPTDGSSTVEIGHKGSEALKVAQVRVYWVKATDYKNPTLSFWLDEDVTKKEVKVWQGQYLTTAMLPTLSTKVDGIEVTLGRTFVSSVDDIVSDANAQAMYADGYTGTVKVSKVGSTAISVTTARDDVNKYLPATAEYTLVVQSIAPTFTEQNTQLNSKSTIALDTPDSSAGATVYYCINPTDPSDITSWIEYTDAATLQTYIDDVTDVTIYAKAVLNEVSSEIVSHHYVIDETFLLAPSLVIYENATITDGVITGLSGVFTNSQFHPEHGNLYAEVTNTTAGAIVYYEIIQMGFDEDGNNLTDYRGNFNDDSDGVSPGTTKDASKILTIKNSVNIRIWAEMEVDGITRRSEEVIRRIIYNDENTNVITAESFLGSGTSKYIKAERNIHLNGMTITYGGIKETEENKKHEWRDNWTPMKKTQDSNLDKLGVKGVLVYQDDKSYVSVTSNSDAVSEWATPNTDDKGGALTESMTIYSGGTNHAGHYVNTDKRPGGEYRHCSNTDPVHNRTFNLPVYGAFWKFEPTKNGEIILHVEQQGCLNQETVDGNKRDRYDEIRIRPVYFVDEQGKSIRAKSFSTEARLDPGFLNFFKDPNNGNINHVVEPTGKDAGYMQVMKLNGWYTDQDCYKIFDMYRTFLQKTLNNGGYHSSEGAAGSIWDNAFKKDNEKPGGYDVNTDNENGWGAKQEIIVLHSGATNNPAGYDSVMLKKLAAVNDLLGDTNYDGTGYMLTTEGYAKYRFPVEAGKTYFFFGWRTKFGVSGYEWNPNPGYEAEIEKAERSFTLYNSDADAVKQQSKTNNTVILDDKNVAYPEEDFYGTTVDHTTHRQYNITLNRTFKAQHWAPIVLPFSVSQTQLRKIFGDKVQVVHFDNIEQVNNNDVTFRLNFLKHHYQMLVAGTPAYIYPDGIDGDGEDIDSENNVVNPQFTNVTLEMNDDTGITAIDDAKGNSMVGSFKDDKIEQYGLFIGTSDENPKDKIYQYTGTSGLTINSLRSWVKLKSATGAAKFNMATFDITGGGENKDLSAIINIEADGIAEDNAHVTKATFNNRVYTLKGQCVGVPADIELLPKGIYILNGRKFVKK